MIFNIANEQQKKSGYMSGWAQLHAGYYCMQEAHDSAGPQ